MGFGSVEFGGVVFRGRLEILEIRNFRNFIKFSKKMLSLSFFLYYIIKISIFFNFSSRIERGY